MIELKVKRLEIDPNNPKRILVYADGYFDSYIVLSLNPDDAKEYTLGRRYHIKLEEVREQ